MRKPSCCQGRVNALAREHGSKSLQPTVREHRHLSSLRFLTTTVPSKVVPFQRKVAGVQNAPTIQAELSRLEKCGHQLVLHNPSLNSDGGEGGWPLHAPTSRLSRTPVELFGGQALGHLHVSAG